MKLSIRKFLLSLTLLVPALQQTVYVDNVTYLYRSWNKDTKTVKTKTRTAKCHTQKCGMDFPFKLF